MPIKITFGTGFHLTFANGWTVSVQLGLGAGSTSCSLPRHGADYFNAEVGVWNSRGVWDADYPRYHQTPDQIAAIIAEVAARNP